MIPSQTNKPPQIEPTMPLTNHTPSATTLSVISGPEVPLRNPGYRLFLDPMVPLRNPDGVQELEHHLHLMLARVGVEPDHHTLSPFSLQQSQPKVTLPSPPI